MPSDELVALVQVEDAPCDSRNCYMQHPGRRHGVQRSDGRWIQGWGDGQRMRGLAGQGDLPQLERLGLPPPV